MKNKYQLQNELKNTGLAYLFLFILGAHYAYMGKWFVQILFWITLGGFLIWWFIDLFRIPSMVNNHNSKIYHHLERLDNLSVN